MDEEKNIGSECRDEISEKKNENVVTSSLVNDDEKTEEKNENENQINANESPKCMNTNQCKKTNQPQQQQQQQQNKKNYNRRRKRSYRTRKNSGNFKFNPKGKKRDIQAIRDQARQRHQLFFTDSQRLVPYNTNSFLMEDHFNYQPYNHHDSFSSSDCGMSGSIDEDEFLQKEFNMDYENLRSEQLNEMSKEQLIQEFLKLENQTEAKENEILALNNKIKELSRRLMQKNGGGNNESEDSESDSSTSSSSSSSSSCSSASDCGIMEHDANNDEYSSTVINELQPVKC
ncbi:hypothetical protein PVAND_004000 [Polypedilum vanderplanki]|uniref:Protein HEXIM1 n=1 Tax=Polypedilum vanderplanki TaxID=319348 RepID=A0A9J6BVS8_POLVA|nr:hypothetical protein PVAND_004000 [Polypedilum vanderplanki]